MARPRAIDRQQLVEAAAVVFERSGYADATLDQIAAQAGISKPTVYQYVKSKSHLLEIIVEQVVYPIRDGVERIVESDATAAEKLDAFVRVHVDSAIRYRPYYAVLLADQHQLSPQALRNYEAWARKVNHAAEQLLRQGVAEGVVRRDIDIPIAVNLLNSTLIAIARWYRPGDRLSPEAIRTEVMRFLSGLFVGVTVGTPA